MSEYIITSEQLIEVFDKLHSWDFPEWLHEFVYTRKLFCPKLTEIVRCRDCREYHPDIYKNITCELILYHTEPDDFCSLAVRKVVG